ncbi:MAG: aminoglycoside phosphotransferase family protein [Chloroflexota bacterium]|nr:aminoglycoside phosphotransferase family protein [Chloroflexota bacterium]
MLKDPGLHADELTETLRAAYGIHASALAFIPSYDPHAASYEVTTRENSFFLKVWFDDVHEATLRVARTLHEAGVPNILAPIPTFSSALYTPMQDRTLVLQPFRRGQNAMVAGMSTTQWRTFGATLRAVHDSGLERRFADTLPIENFSLAAGDPVRRFLELAAFGAFASPAAAGFAAFWQEQAGRIGAMLERAEELGARLQTRSFARVLCHADIHAANILVTDDGGIVLVDWDGPMIAPRERDLLFVIGSRIARRVEPNEEAWFFEGYGAVGVDTDAIIYYRYERILEDMGVDAESVFGDASLPEATRQTQANLVMSFFAPGGILESVEEVTVP